MLQSTNKMFINVTVKTSTREKNVYGYLVFFTDLNDSGYVWKRVATGASL